MNCDKTSLLSVRIKLVHSCLDNIRYRAHGNDDILCIRSAIVAERCIGTACDLAYCLHVVGNNVWNCIVIFILCFPCLEVDVGVLCCSACNRMLWVKSLVPVALKGFPVNQRTQILHIHLLYLLDLVRCAEAVEEMEEWNASLDSGKVGHRSQVHDLLYRAGCKHCKACGTGSHDIGVVAENRERLSSQRTCCDMENAREELSRYFIHIRDHEKKTLGCCECGGQGTSLQRTMDCTGGTALRLHLYNFDLLAEKVFSAICRPFINILCHRG